MGNPTAAAQAVRAERRRVLRGLLDPNPGAGRLLSVPTVLATAPTITLGTANAATAISGSTLVAMTDPQFTYYGCPAGFGATFPDSSVWYRPDNIQAWDGSKTIYAPGPWAVEFECYDSAFELSTSGNGTNARYRMTVLYDSANPTRLGYDARGGRSDLPNTGSNYLVKYDFGVAGFRRIRFDFNSNVRFGGIRIGPNGSLWKTSRPAGPKVVVIGDSFTGGALNVQGINTFPEMMRWQLGWSDVYHSGAGGTGYLNDNVGTKSTYRTRIIKDALALDPDIVLATGGINDEASDKTALLAEANALFAQIRAATDAALIVTGVQWKNGGPNSNIIRARDAVRAAAEVHAHLYIEEIGGTYPYDSGANYATGWMTGSGFVGTTTGTGNSDLFTDTDNTHPTQAGQDFRGSRIASGVAAWLAADAPFGSTYAAGVLT